MFSRFGSNKLKKKGEVLTRGELYLLSEESKLDRHCLLR